jgi:hypothetical protein
MKFKVVVRNVPGGEHGEGGAYWMARIESRGPNT